MSRVSSLALVAIVVALASATWPDAVAASDDLGEPLASQEYSAEGQAGQPEDHQEEPDPQIFHDDHIGTGDFKPPIPLALKFRQKQIRTADGPAKVVAEARIRDDHSGFDNGYLQLVSPSGKQERQCVFSHDHHFNQQVEVDADGNPVNPTGDRKLEDTHECEVEFARHSEPGVWRVANYHVQDTIGNSHHYPMQQLRLLGHDYSIEIIDPSGGDSKPPRLVGLRIEPSTVDTTNGPKNVTLYLDIEDDKAGIETGHLSVSSYSGKQIVTQTLHDLHLVSGNDHKGTYETHMELSQHHEAGLWRIDTIELIDQVKNSVQIHAQQLNLLKLPYKFQVESDQDTDAPEILDIVINPSKIIAGDPFEVILTVKEEKAGVEYAMMTLTNPSRHVETSLMFFPENADSSDLQAGSDMPHILRAESETSVHWAEGPWEIRELQLLDRVHNDKYYLNEDLKAKGLPTTLVVQHEEDEGFKDEI